MTASNTTVKDVIISSGMLWSGWLSEFQIGHPHPRPRPPTPMLFMVMGATDNSWVGMGESVVVKLKFYLAL